MYDGTTKEYDLNRSDHGYINSIEVFYHTKEGLLTSTDVYEYRSFLEGIGAESIQDYIQDFIRFDIDCDLYDFYRYEYSEFALKGGDGNIKKQIDQVDPDLNGTRLVYEDDDHCAHFYVDTNKVLHIEDPVTGYKEKYYVEIPGIKELVDNHSSDIIGNTLQIADYINVFMIYGEKEIPFVNSL